MGNHGLGTAQRYNGKVIAFGADVEAILPGILRLVYVNVT
jgi:hypothetical protein